MLTADRTVHHRSSRSLRYCSRGPNCHGAVDDCHRGPEKLDVAGGLTNKILDGKRVADMENIDLIDRLDIRRDVYSDGLVVLRDKLEEWLADLSQTGDNDSLLFRHCHDLLPKRHSNSWRTPASFPEFRD